MEQATSNQLNQLVLWRSLENLATQLDLCAQHFSDISRQIDGLSQNVRKASYVPAHVADSCLVLLEEISTSGVTTAQGAFKGNAAAGIVVSCTQIKRTSQLS